MSKLAEAVARLERIATPGPLSQESGDADLRLVLTALADARRQVATDHERFGGLCIRCHADWPCAIRAGLEIGEDA